MHCPACGRLLSSRTHLCQTLWEAYSHTLYGMSLLNRITILEVPVNAESLFSTTTFPGNSSLLPGTSSPSSSALPVNSTSQTNHIGYPLLIHETETPAIYNSLINPSSPIEQLNSTSQMDNVDTTTNEITLHENQYLSELFHRLKMWKWPRHGPGCRGSEHIDAVENSCICIKIANDSSCSDIDIRRDRSAPVETAVSVIPSEFDPTNTYCIFCLCEFSYNDTLCTLPCNHTFHKNGIYRWLTEMENMFRCPTCRKSVFK